MGCKHREVIAIQNDGNKEYFCKVFEKRVSDYECNKCMMRLEDNNMQDLINIFLGKGFIN